ncbi:hypothetical protein Barb4_03048 [Bacteroidales bacterium Barb4]|nr:hypothetical protein Barb4_03048 [Bacteroidales bacterium Barb4]
MRENIQERGKDAKKGVGRGRNVGLKSVILFQNQASQRALKYPMDSAMPRNGSFISFSYSRPHTPV